MQIDRGTTWLVRGLLGVGVAYLAFLTWFAVRLHVRVEVDDPSGEISAGSLLVGRARAAVPLAPASGLAPFDLAIENAGGGLVRVLDASTAHRGVLPLASFALQGFEPEENGQRLVARDEGARASFKGYGSDVILTLGASPDAGRARILWNGVFREVELRATAVEPREVRLPSTTRLLHAQVSPWISRLEVKLPQPGREVRTAILFGNEVLHEQRSAAGTTEVVVAVPPALRGRIVWLFLSNALTLIGRTAVLWVVFSIAGLIVLLPALSRLTSLERLALPGIVGFSLVVVATTSSIYVTGAKVGLPVVLGLLTVLAALFHRRGLAEARLLWIEALRDVRRWRVEAGAAALFGAILFFPAFLEGEWYLGHNLVDVFHYTNFGQAFIHRPFHEVSDHVWFSRFSDCVSLSVSALLLREDTRSVYALTGFWVWTTVPFAASALLARLGRAEVAGRFGALLVGASASLFALFAQSYWAHFLFVAALLWSLPIAACAQELGSEASAPARRAALLGVGAVFAFAISVYSFHFLVPLGWVAALFFLKGDRRAPIRELFLAGAATALLVNVNASVILFFRAMRRYYGDFKQVDEIARYIVFPFADSPQFLAIAYGVRDFARNSRFFTNVASEVLALDPATSSAALATIRSAYFANGWGLAAAAAALTVVGFVQCLDRRSLPRLLVASTAIGFLLYLGYLIASQQLYARAKLVMTLAAVLVPLAALGAATLWQAARWRRGWRIAVAAFAVGYVGWNLFTATVESADAWLNRKSHLLFELGTHLPDVDVELKQLAAFLEARDDGRPYQVATECYFLDRRATNGDKILVARIDHLGLVGARGRLLGPESTWEVRFKDPNCDRPEDVPPALETASFRVFPPRSDGRGVPPWLPTATSRRW